MRIHGVQVIRSGEFEVLVTPRKGAAQANNGPAPNGWISNVPVPRRIWVAPGGPLDPDCSRAATAYSWDCQLLMLITQWPHPMKRARANPRWTGGCGWLRMRRLRHTPTSSKTARPSKRSRGHMRRGKEMSWRGCMHRDVRRATKRGFQGEEGLRW
jgi:hypothetical protein